MNFLQKLFKKLKENNIFTSILLIDIIFTLLFFLNPFMIYISGDIDLLLSIITGILYFSKVKRADQRIYSSYFKICIIGGLISSISAIIISFLNTPPDQYTSIAQIIAIFILLGQVIGLFLASIASLIVYLNKNKGEFKK